MYLDDVELRVIISTISYVGIVINITLCHLQDNFVGHLGTPPSFSSLFLTEASSRQIKKARQSKAADQLPPNLLHLLHLAWTPTLFLQPVR